MRLVGCRAAGGDCAGGALRKRLGYGSGSRRAYKLRVIPMAWRHAGWADLLLRQCEGTSARSARRSRQRNGGGCRASRRTHFQQQSARDVASPVIRLKVIVANLCNQWLVLALTVCGEGELLRLAMGIGFISLIVRPSVHCCRSCCRCGGKPGILGVALSGQVSCTRDCGQGSEPC